MTDVADLTAATRDRAQRVDLLLQALRHPTSDLSPTQAAVRTVLLRYERASLSGRDDDIRTAQDAAEAALARGLVSDDLLTALARIHLDGHDLDAVTELLDRCRFTTTSTTVRRMRAAVLLQRGDAVAAAELIRSLLIAEPSWQNIAGLAAVYDELGDITTADQLYRSAEHDLDAKQLPALAWLEIRRARLSRRAGDVARARARLSRAEQAWLDWQVAAERIRCQLQDGDLDGAQALAEALVAHTSRPDHEHLLADVCRAVGELDGAARHYDIARRGYLAAGHRWPWRYLHHQVELHLRAGTPADVEAALRLAERDHRHRPHGATGRLVVDVLLACGQAARADALMADLDRERGRALAALPPLPYVALTDPGGA